MLDETTAANKERIEEARDTLLDWSVYFALVAKLCGQTAMAFNAVAKIPEAIPPELSSKALLQVRRIARDCGAFRDGMETIGSDFNLIMNKLNAALTEHAQKSKELESLTDESRDREEPDNHTPT